MSGNDRQPSTSEQQLADIRYACEAKKNVLRYAPIQPQIALDLVDEIERLRKIIREGDNG